MNRLTTYYKPVATEIVSYFDARMYINFRLVSRASHNIADEYLYGGVFPRTVLHQFAIKMRCEYVGPVCRLIVLLAASESVSQAIQYTSAMDIRDTPGIHYPEAVVAAAMLSGKLSGPLSVIWYIHRTGRQTHLPDDLQRISDAAATYATLTQDIGGQSYGDLMLPVIQSSMKKDRELIWQFLVEHSRKAGTGLWLAIYNFSQRFSGSRGMPYCLDIAMDTRFLSQTQREIDNGYMSSFTLNDLRPEWCKRDMSSGKVMAFLRGH